MMETRKMDWTPGPQSDDCDGLLRLTMPNGYLITRHGDKTVVFDMFIPFREIPIMGACDLCGAGAADLLFAESALHRRGHRIFCAARRFFTRATSRICGISIYLRRVGLREGNPMFPGEPIVV
jgi:hypothetical protein